MQFLEDVGSPCPQFTNPFDHLMDLDLATIWGGSNDINEVGFDWTSFSESTLDVDARVKEAPSLH